MVEEVDFSVPSKQVIPTAAERFLRNLLFPSYRMLWFLRLGKMAPYHL
jgi:hypothetical protein